VSNQQETREELLDALEQIERWEAGQKDLWFWEKIGRMPFQLLDRLTPAFLHKKIGEALNELGHYLQAGGKYLISEKATLARLERAAREGGWTDERSQPQGRALAFGEADAGRQAKTFGEADAGGRDLPLVGVAEMTLEAVRYLPLHVMDQAADSIVKMSAKAATLQGATTGVGGIFTLAVDIPAVLAMSLKQIQEIAICYGFNPQEKEERIFTVKCLQFSSSDIVGKRAILEELAAYGADREQTQMISQLQGWREVFATYRDNWGWKKLFQLIPIAGIVFGAWINRSTLQDVGEAAAMLYRKRRILERLREAD